MQLITIKDSHFASELLVLKSRLESEGIECRLKNDLTSQVLNHIPSMLVELQVSENDLEKVKRILIEIGELPQEQQEIKCPKCGSAKYKIKRSIKEKWKIVVIVFVSLITFVPVDNFTKNSILVCQHCNNEFKQ